MVITEDKAIPKFSKPLMFDRSVTDALSKMVLQLQRNHLVVLSGPSGGGKSTFATETLCRYLRNGETEGKNGKAWRTVVTAPFADPIGNLAAALSRRGALFSQDAKIDRARIEQTLREDRNALATLCAEAKGDTSEKFNFLLVVDQKEELYRYRNILQALGRGGDDLHYVNLLLNAIQHSRDDVAIYVVFVADTRNFDYFTHYRGLPEAMNNFRMELPGLTSEEIRAILKKYQQPNDLAAFRRQNEKLEREDDREAANINLAFFRWLSHSDQTDFVDRLLKDFDELKDDPFAAQKFNIFLCWVVEVCIRQNEQGIASGPLDVYDKLGPMGNVVQNFIEREIWSKFTPEQQKQTELLFKALTLPNAGKRRPLQWDELDKLVSRNAETPPHLQWDTAQSGVRTDHSFNAKRLREILLKFNTTSEVFFLPLDWDTWPDRVVDINADILIMGWDRPQKWIEEEQKHADIYRDLVDAAITFFSQKQLHATKGILNVTSATPQREPLWEVIKDWWHKIYPTDRPKSTGKVTRGSLYLEGATLANAIHWMETQRPDAFWAARYDPPASDLQHRQLRATLPPSLEDTGDWELARRFLALSAEQEKLKRDQEERSRQKEMSLQRKSVITAVLATVACIAALGFWRWAERTNQKVKMVDFTEMLEANGCLDVSPAERFDKMYELTALVWNSNPSDEYDVLEELAQNGALPIDMTNQENKKIAFDALYNIGWLFTEQMNNDTAGYGALEDLLAIYERTRSRPDRQFPMVYHALLAHQNTYLYRRPATTKFAFPKAAIEKTAVASNPAQWHEFAYGDKNGHIFIRNGQRADTLPSIGQEIKSVSFSPDGKRFYVATKTGAVFKYDYASYKSGIKPKNIKSQIRNEDGTPVYFVREWDDKYLVICNTNQIRLLRKPDTPDAAYQEFKYAQIDLPAIRLTEWTPDRKWLFAAGQDATVIYQLDSSAIYRHGPDDGKIRETARITHPNITMASVAVKFDSTGQVWLALGGEEGRIWLAAAKNASMLKEGCSISDTKWFTCYPKVHETSVSSIKFNEKYPQMASSDAFGYVYFWNLLNPGEAYDRIRVRRRGESITTIAYVNPDELVAFENIYVWLVKANIRALKEDVETLIKHK